ncbi:hypothetical protein [Frateuria defendens]|uniref:hypothetical protein n=1 Tax=Frateuria defendens TaxID=2219559 RepID=UPI001293E44D|nr:hypothetical protein [Frateuria defendens]
MFEAGTAAAEVWSCMPYRWGRSIASSLGMFFKVRTHLGVAVAAWLCTASAGAVTIKTVVNADSSMCGQLLKMVEVAGVPQMTDEQLCDFRFARLPPSMTEGFTFPQWKELAVADAPGMYVQMITANRAPHAPYGLPDLSSRREAVNQAMHEHNLAFYKTILPVSEFKFDYKTSSVTTVSKRDLTFVSMDIRHCSKLPYKDLIAFPFYAAFAGTDLKNPVPTDSIMSGDQMAWWRGNRLVRINVSYHWVTIGSRPPGIVVDLENLWWHPEERKLDAAITGGTHCSFSIDK